MKIAFLLGSLYIGGAQRFVTNITSKLAESSHTIYLITGKAGNNEYGISPKVNRVILMKNRLLMDIISVRAFLIKKGIDICVAVCIYEEIVLSMANFHLRTKTVLSERSAPQQALYSNKIKILRWIFFRRADYFVFQTDEAKSFYSKKIQKRSAVIPNPVKENLPYREQSNKEFVAVGRLEKVKNYDLLMNAFYEVHKVHPEYKLKIFGTGNEKGYLLKLKAQLKLEGCVLFEGFHRNVHEKIKNSDIFVMTSDYEGMPNALLEAMAMGFPVISTDCPVGAPREMIIDGYSGILVPVGHKEKLVEAMKRLIEENDLKDKLGRNAFERSKDYSIDIIEKQWTDMFEELIS